MINCPGFPETGQFLGTHDLYNWESLSKLKGVGYPLSKSSFKGFPGSPEVKNLPANSENTVNRWSGKIPQQFSSVAQLCPTLCDPIDHSTSGLPIITNSRSLPKPMSIESVMPSSHLILCRPLLVLPSLFPSVRVFSNESTLHIRWPKFWSFSFNISPSDEHPGLISFRMDWLDLLAVQGTLKSLLQHHSSK